MSRKIVKVTMKLLSDTIFGSGNSVPSGEDIALRVDHQAKPLVPGTTLKGLLRESLENYLDWIGEDPRLLDVLLGCEGRDETEDGRRVIFSDLLPDHLPEEELEWSSLRSFTALEDGVAKAGSLRTAACLNSGLSFSGILLCAEEDLHWLRDGLKGIQWVGLLRNRGFGHVKVEVGEFAALETLCPVKNASVLHYRLRAVTPVSIPWLNHSGVSYGEKRNFTESRSYIPGSAVRGMVLSELAEQNPAWFEQNRDVLLRNVIFTEAFPTDGGRSVIPTPKGFYDEKNGNNPYSVLLQDVQPGHKRVSMGQFCYVEDGLIHGSAPAMTSMIRIQRGDSKQMFTVRAMAAGTELEGYIRLEDPAMTEPICQAFRKFVWLGADRYAGCGLCQVTLLDGEAPDMAAYGFGPDDELPSQLHMLLLSPMTMTRNGEPVGIDEEKLASLLGVASVRLGRSAVSMTETAGFNRTWGCACPVLTMYDAGSMFTLECSEPPSRSAVESLERVGLGICRNEGYGRVLFIKDFAHRFAGKATSGEQTTELSETAKLRRARYNWLMEHPLKHSLSSSQMGSIQVLCEAIIAGTRTLEDLQGHLQHNRDERGARHGEKYRKLYPLLQPIWSVPLGETLGMTDCPDSLTERIKLLRDWVAINRKGGSNR